MRKNLSNYTPGILLFLIALLIGLTSYQDYGMSWDEPAYRQFGLLAYDYVYHIKKELLTTYFVGFELPLVFIEKLMNITDPRDIYLMRHLVTHILFLVSALSMYVLVFRLFRNRFLACHGFIMLVLCPRIYAHSFFNSRDIPFLSLFIITLVFCQLAFDKNKPMFFLVLGLLAGYTTSIRIMGIMLAGFIFLFLLADLISAFINKEKVIKPFLSVAFFIPGFCISLYTVWPYLWGHPVHNFIRMFVEMSHFDKWGGVVLFRGKFWKAAEIPCTYFPAWFSITVPVLWLLTGCAGMIMITISLLRKPLLFLKNTRERNFLLYLLCFTVPVLTIIMLQSVIYDDWRHLYFVYPSFVLLGLYCIHALIHSRFRLVTQAACVIQIGLISYFMIKNHPFQQVYFNELVSHKKEYLQNNYEMEYWGCACKQALEHIIATDTSKEIKIAWAVDPVPNNILMLPVEERSRVTMVEYGGNYIITNFRDIAHGRYTDLTPVYRLSVLNSTILCVYKLH